MSLEAQVGSAGKVESAQVAIPALEQWTVSSAAERVGKTELTEVPEVLAVTAARAAKQAVVEKRRFLLPETSAPSQSNTTTHRASRDLGELAARAVPVAQAGPVVTARHSAAEVAQVRPALKVR